MQVPQRLKPPLRESRNAALEALLHPTRSAGLEALLRPNPEFSPWTLQPSLDARYPRGFHAVRGAQFADGFGQIVAYRTLGEAELEGDVTAGSALAGQAKHLSLTVGERIRVRPRLRSPVRDR